MKNPFSWQLLAITILAVTAFVLSAHNTEAHAASGSTNFTVFEHSTNSKSINVGSKHDKRGDYYVFNDTVFNAADKKQIGLSEGTCVFTSNTISECNWTLILSSGNIIISGAAVDTSKTTIYAVTGGTGAYSQAHGDVELQVLKSGEEYKYTFHITE